LTIEIIYEINQQPDFLARQSISIHQVWVETSFNGATVSAFSIWKTPFKMGKNNM